MIDIPETRWKLQIIHSKIHFVLCIFSLCCTPSPTLGQELTEGVIEVVQIVKRDSDPISQIKLDNIRFLLAELQFKQDKLKKQLRGASRDKQESIKSEIAETRKYVVELRKLQRVAERAAKNGLTYVRGWDGNKRTAIELECRKKLIRVADSIAVGDIIHYSANTQYRHLFIDVSGNPKFPRPLWTEAVALDPAHSKPLGWEALTADTLPWPLIDVTGSVNASCTIRSQTSDSGYVFPVLEVTTDPYVNLAEVYLRIYSTDKQGNRVKLLTPSSGEIMVFVKNTGLMGFGNKLLPFARYTEQATSFEIEIVSVFANP